MARPLPLRLLKLRCRQTLAFRCPKVELSAGNPFGQGLGGTSKESPFLLSNKIFFLLHCVHLGFLFWKFPEKET